MPHRTIVASIVTIVFASVVSPSTAFDLRNLELLSHLSIEESGGMGIGNDIWGWTDRSLPTNREYALVGRTAGTAIVDITNPTAPNLVGTIPTQTGTSSWRDIKVYNDHAYIVSDDNGPHGIQIFDLTRLRNVTTPQVFEPDSVYDGVRSAHNITINEETGFAYVSEGHILDLSDPKNPVQVGVVASNTHDTTAVRYRGPDQDYFGREMLFSMTGSSVQIYDVEDKAAPDRISTVQAGSFEHQGWLSEDHEYLFVNAERDQTWTYVLDVRDLDEPVLVGNVPNLRDALDHNLYVKGDKIYAANYAAGLRVFDIVDPSIADLREVAHIDTNPTREDFAFEGAWSTFPFFDSGSVIVNDMVHGLYVVALDFSHGDLNDSGGLGPVDIDMLTSNLANGSTDLRFDINADGVFDYGDILQWLDIAGADRFGSGSGFLVGDANLDGFVDASDFNIWNTHQLTNSNLWSRGDFNADGVVDVSDFNLWNGNRFQSSTDVVAVPEPGFLMLWAGFAFLLVRARPF